MAINPRDSVCERDTRGSSLKPRFGPGSLDTGTIRCVGLMILISSFLVEREPYITLFLRLRSPRTPAPISS